MRSGASESDRHPQKGHEIFCWRELSPGQCRQVTIEASRSYLTVWRMYGYRQFPSFRMLISQTFAYRTLRQLKGMVKPA